MTRQDTLEPALRISTERRLVSLEADLATAQRREVEKKNGARYHQVSRDRPPFPTTTHSIPCPPMGYELSLIPVRPGSA